MHNGFVRIEDTIGPYPGRGLIHLTDSQSKQWWLYFITGRSQASKSRTVRSEDRVVFVESTDDHIGTDPLRHYACVRLYHDGIVVGNGDHVDLLAAGLENGANLGSLVEHIDPEPDPPINTPRIAFILDAESHAISVHRKGNDSIRRVQVLDVAPDSATVLTTYSGPLASPIGNAPLATNREHRNIADFAQSVFHEVLPQELAVLLIAGPVHPPSTCPADWLIHIE